MNRIFTDEDKEKLLTVLLRHNRDATVRDYCFIMDDILKQTGTHREVKNVIADRNAELWKPYLKRNMEPGIQL